MPLLKGLFSVLTPASAVVYDKITPNIITISITKARCAVALTLTTGAFLTVFILVAFDDVNVG
jgi:hypothetical protein